MRKLELRPEAFASLVRRFLISGLSRMLNVALRVFAINTCYHKMARHPSNPVEYVESTASRTNQPTLPLPPALSARPVPTGTL